MVNLAAGCSLARPELPRVGEDYVLNAEVAALTSWSTACRGRPACHDGARVGSEALQPSPGGAAGPEQTARGIERLPRSADSIPAGIRLQLGATEIGQQSKYR
jgi:hypothetical protein